MACACKKSNSINATWGVKMPGPDGAVKAYSSEITARAVVAKIAGAILIPPTVPAS